MWLMLVRWEIESGGHVLDVALDDAVFDRTLSYIDGYARDLQVFLCTPTWELSRPLELEVPEVTVVRLG